MAKLAKDRRRYGREERGCRWARLASTSVGVLLHELAMEVLDVADVLLDCGRKDREWVSRSFEVEAKNEQKKHLSLIHI